MRAALLALASALVCHRAPPATPRDAPPPRAAAPAADRVAPPADGLPAPFATPSATNPARVVRWPSGASPRAASGARVTLWADQVGDVRAVAQAPSGEVFATSRDGELRVFIDGDGDGRAEARETFADDLELPFGIAFHPAGWLYVAETSALQRWRYRPGMRRPEGPPERVVALPGRGYNQHWTRSVAVSPDGAQVFVGVGSESNVDREPDPRAAILRVAADGSTSTVFARGLRNPVGMAFSPRGSLVAAVNERDGLGDDLPPDYLTTVREGAHYGWPFAYWGAHEDPRHAGERPDLVAAAVRPEVALGAHVAPIAVVFPTRGRLGVPAGDALVSLHGSWNRAHPVGYKVVRVRFRDGAPVGPPEDFVTGWLQSDGTTWGRPAGMCELADGSLLVVDDGAHVIWRVTPSP